LAQTLPGVANPARRRLARQPRRQGLDRRIRLADLRPLRQLPQAHLPELKTKYIDTGKVRFICANSRSIRSPPPASCSPAAPERDKYFDVMDDLLFARAARLGLHRRSR
jgi:hypothetical protein